MGPTSHCARINQPPPGPPSPLATCCRRQHKLARFFLGHRTCGRCFFFGLAFQQMVNWWFGARWFGFLGSPYERDCYLGVSLESQTTNPNHQSTISWALMVKKKSSGLGVKGTGREIESHWHPVTPLQILRPSTWVFFEESLRSHTPT